MEGNSSSRIAYGTINPFTFIQDAPGIPFGALQATGGGVPIVGVAAEWVNNMMGTSWQTAFSPQGYPAAASGNPIRVYEQFDMNAMVVVGSGQTVLPNQLLVSDASGYAKPVTMSGGGQQWIGARALEGGVAGTLIRCQVLFGDVYT
jgi:hypothetical protein